MFTFIQCYEVSTKDSYDHVLSETTDCDKLNFLPGLEKSKMAATQIWGESLRSKHHKNVCYTSFNGSLRMQNTLGAYKFSISIKLKQFLKHSGRHPSFQQVPTVQLHPRIFGWCHSLTYWGRDKTATFSQTSFSNVFSWMKMYEFPLRFHWSFFLSVELTV